MVNIDFWYGNALQDITGLDCFFYPNDGVYRGSLYIDNKIVGDFSGDDSVELDRTFPGMIWSN